MSTGGMKLHVSEKEMCQVAREVMDCGLEEAWHRAVEHTEKQVRINAAVALDQVRALNRGARDAVLTHLRNLGLRQAQR